MAIVFKVFLAALLFAFLFCLMPVIATIGIFIEDSIYGHSDRRRREREKKETREHIKKRKANGCPY